MELAAERDHERYHERYGPAQALRGFHPPAFLVSEATGFAV